MKREILAGVLAAPLCSGGQASAEKINIKGNSKGTAVAGEYVDSSGDPRKSTPKQVEGQQKYVKKYDGAVVLDTAMQNIYSPTAVPEPATWLAVVVGLGAVAGLRRRKRAALSPSQERRCARLRPD